MKRYTILGIIVIVSLGLWSSCVMAADIEAVLETADDTTAFVVQDSTTAELFRVRADGKVGIGTTSPAEALEVDGTIKLSGESATYKITNVLDPTAAQDVATKAYVDAQGGGCYSKCADSGTSAGGATPSCPGGYSSVDTWSERAGFGQYQWGGMNSANYDAHVTMIEEGAGGTLYNETQSNGASFSYWPQSGATMPHGSFWQYLTCGGTNQPFMHGVATYAWNTGYGSGAGNTSYYNDCVACCAD